MGGEELQENFEKDALFYEGTEKWQKNMNTALLFQGLSSMIVVKTIAENSPNTAIKIIIVTQPLWNDLENVYVAVVSFIIYNHLF